MNKTQIKALLKPQMDIIINAERSLSTTAWERNKAIYDMTKIISFRKCVAYTSFNDFCTKELPITYNTAMVYHTDYARMINLGYTHKEILQIAVKVPYVITQKYAMYLKRTRTSSRKQRVSYFIRDALAFVVKVSASSGSRHNQISLCLSDTHLYKLEVMLKPHGYRKTSNSIRMNISRAFEAWLDTL